MIDQALSPPEMLEISCENCGADLIVEPALKTAECPYCASTSIVERPASGGHTEPVYALGFVIGRDRARELCLAWIKSRGLFTPKSFKTAPPERGRGLYSPAYLFCAVAHSEYTCQIGENYTETYTTTDSKGRVVVRTRTRTEHRSLAGRSASYVRDVLVTASAGISNKLLEQVEPFDLRALLRYTPALLSGWIAEEASVAREECRALARTESLEKIGQRLSRMMPGDSHSDLRYSTRLEDEVTDLLLLPIWVFAVKHETDAEPVQILVNGQTGEVAGFVPRSWTRILGVTLIVLLLALAVFAVVGAALSF